MATTTSLRFRRSAAQLHALAGVEREIRSSDHNSRGKYLRDFRQAFRSYESVIDMRGLKARVAEADIVLIGDYHALPASQRFAATLFEDRAHPGDRPVVLGLETIFARDQHILDEWWRRQIDEDELRQRIRFHLDWGYDWAPFYDLLTTAREHGDAIYGLDCLPRNDLRKIHVRDAHATHKIAEIRQRHPDAVIMVLFGESHFAPNHLPRRLKDRLPSERVLTVLQNVDALYWRAAGEQHEHVEAVEVSKDVVCAFNATPLEKYESYRICLDRWGHEAEASDLAPTIYNLIDSLVRFLGIDRYSPNNGKQPKFLVDLLPEVYCGPDLDLRLRQLLLRAGESEKDATAMLAQAEERGSVYLPRLNALYIRDFQMMYAGEEAARFLHHACRGLPLIRRIEGLAPLSPNDLFYARVVEHAIGYFGSRVLHPARPAMRDIELAELYETGSRRLREIGSHESDSLAQRIGYAIGSDLYDAYIAGTVRPVALKRLLLSHLDQPGAAAALFRRIALRTRSNAKKPPSRVRSVQTENRQGISPAR